MLDNLHMPYPDYEPPPAAIKSGYSVANVSQGDVEICTRDLINWIDDVEQMMPVTGQLSSFELEQQRDAETQHELAVAWQERKKKSGKATVCNPTSAAATPVTTVITTVFANTIMSSSRNNDEGGMIESEVDKQCTFVYAHCECIYNWMRQRLVKIHPNVATTKNKLLDDIDRLSIAKN